MLFSQPPLKCTPRNIKILTAKGYQVEYRGLVAVKGKGELETYYVLGKAAGRFGVCTRQPSQHASLAAVVYGMVQARCRQNTVKRSNTPGSGGLSRTKSQHSASTRGVFESSLSPIKYTTDGDKFQNQMKM